MSLNCLTCQTLRRTDSDKEKLVLSPDHSSGSGESGPEINQILRKVCCGDAGRSWSGNLSPRMYEKIGRSGSSLAQKMKKVKKSHHHHHVRLSSNNSSMVSPEEPRLVRSSGMRRDWSFENLSQL